MGKAHARATYHSQLGLIYIPPFTPKHQESIFKARLHERFQPIRCITQAQNSNRVCL